jgi:hypothetical protein
MASNRLGRGERPLSRALASSSFAGKLSAQIELILLITGLVTAGALVLFLAPATMLKLLFGQAPSDTLSLLIVRHWGLLVCLVGALLIYAAYRSEVRFPTLIVAIVEKAALVIGVIVSPLQRRPMVLVTALADAGMAAVYFVNMTGI